MFGWNDVRIFLAVYRERSFTKAGQLLGSNQSTVSRRIAALEKELGTPLFSRTPDGLLPTDSAERIVEQAEKMEQSAFEITRLMDDQEAVYEGVVRVAAADGASAHFIAPSLPRFFSLYPNIRLELVPGNEVVDLSRREADLALRFVRPTQGELVAKRIMHSTYGVYASESYLKRFDGVPTLEELDWITWDHHLSHLTESRWYIANIHQEPILRSSHMGTILNAALAGVGAILSARTFARWIPLLQEIPTERQMPPDVNMWLVCHQSIRYLPKIQAVWDFLESATLELAEKGTDWPLFRKK